MTLKGTSLCGYGAVTLQRDKYICRYCGFDGSSFDNWLQMSVDHVKPVSQGGGDGKDNLVACCKACNSFTSRMKIPNGMSNAKIIAMKKDHVTKRRNLFKEFWDNL